MKIIACIKQVPDTETRIKLIPGANHIDTKDVKFIINPYDEFALEEALKTKEKLGGDVTVITVGPPDVEPSIRECFARGVDNGIRIWSDGFEHIDTLGTARLLAKAISNNGYDLIVCGKNAIDDDSAQVGTMIAEFLGIPQVPVVIKADISATSAKLHRQIEGGTEVLEVSLPALFTAQKGLNEPRYPSLKGKMAAKKKSITVIDGKTSGVDVTPKVSILDMKLPSARTAGTILKDLEPAEAAAKIAKFLREEAKVI
jgi:electron transfer flavoprotein beta subunit